jgi:nicotinamide-nucleotide amidase
MTAEIITIGDELLIGQVINTNQAFIAEQLNLIGIRVDRMTTVGDDLEEITSALGDALRRADVVMVTGGLGPTHDDVTRTAVCRFFRTDLTHRPEVLEQIRRLLASRGIPLSPVHEDQALVPRTAKVIPNGSGTAPGMLFEQDGRVLMVFPGVPYEMRGMVEGTAVPYLASLRKGSVIVHRTLRTTGVPESVLARQIGDLEPVLQGAKLAFLPSVQGVRLRITVEDTTEGAGQKRLAEVEDRIRAKVAKHIYGVEKEELEEVLGRMLAERGLSIAVAESCTGGLIADRLTDVSGSSRYLLCGVVAYSNESKRNLLGVPGALIARHGAVSEDVAKAMAEGVRKAAGASIGLSTTGIAGPTGGTPEKPVGLVWIGYADDRGSLALKLNLGDHRRRTKERASQAALELVRREILASSS